ncbi:MAG TPA: hypothetical protein VLM40_21225 [Gemmata sp.]|nr:hypothetical protein [Gemmata sp.]
MGKRDGKYTTLLMSTGLTFGTISALFGLNNGKIDDRQYTILVTVVIASAVVPTMIAQTFFMPRQSAGGTLQETSPEIEVLLDLGELPAPELLTSLNGEQTDSARAPVKEGGR